MISRLPDEIVRVELERRLEAAATARLTFVTAPAGWGKTTAVAQWARAHADGLVWFDGGHDGPFRTFADLLPVDTRYLVVDVADRLPVEALAALGELLEDGPQALHVIVVARDSTILASAVARLAARGTVTHIRRAELRFTQQDVYDVAQLRRSGGITHDEAAALLARTDGWPAAVTTALMTHDASSHADQFVDYVDREVLGGVAPQLRDEILAAAAVDQFEADLAHALVPGEHAHQLLEFARAHDLLDAIGGVGAISAVGGPGAAWKYPPPLRDAFRALLRRDHPDREPTLLEAAANWHLERGDVTDVEAAGSYLVRAGAWAALGALVSSRARLMQMHGRTPALLAWLAAMPSDAIAFQPELVLTHAALLTLVGDTVPAEARLGELGDIARLSPCGRAHAEMIRSIWELGHLAPAEALTAADAALALYDSSANDGFVTLAGLVTPASARTVAVLGRSRALWLGGEVSLGASELRAETYAGDTHPLSRMNVFAMVAVMEAWHGRPTLAVRHAAQAQRAARLALVADHPYLAVAELALAHVYIERGRTDRAAPVLERAARLMAPATWLLFRTMLVLEQAWLAYVDGDSRRAVRLIDDHQRHAHGAPYVRARAAATAARALLALGDRTGARGRLADAGGLTSEVAPLAVEIALADGDIRTAQDIMESWTPQPELQHQLSFALHAASVKFARGDRAAALEATDAIAGAAEAEGFVRLFLDAGSHARALLVAAARAAPSGYFAALMVGASRAAAPASSDVAVVALTERERDVLSHLADRLSYAEIAEKLRLSQNTIKSHAQHVYEKLGVRSRREAVHKAIELGLL